MRSRPFTSTGQVTPGINYRCCTNRINILNTCIYLIGQYQSTDAVEPLRAKNHQCYYSSMQTRATSLSIVCSEFNLTNVIAVRKTPQRKFMPTKVNYFLALPMVESHKYSPLPDQGVVCRYLSRIQDDSSLVWNILYSVERPYNLLHRTLHYPHSL